VDAGFAVFCASHDGDVCAGSLAKGQLGPRKITVHMQNATLHGLLNAIVAQNGKAVWAVMVPPPGSGDYWHLYPIDRPFEPIVLDDLVKAGTH